LNFRAAGKRNPVIGGVLAAPHKRMQFSQRCNCNRSNVLFYFYNFDRTPPTRSGISMFPVLPTVGVEATF
jgi:hypothetical protein